jgi:flagellar basal body rod protein FlgG
LGAQLDKILAAGARSISASQIGLEVTARNISQSSAPGYKREVFSFEAAALGPMSRLQTDTRAGSVAPSDSPLDLAIEGDAYFLVEMDGGQFLTRSGQFTKGEDGILVGNSGQLLLDEAGAPISISSNDVEILPNGTVLDRGEPVARIALVVPSEPMSLRAVGGTLFEASTTIPADLSSAQIRQRALEGSNVETAAEMTSMMLALRMAEAGARLVQTYDGLMGQAITTLGRGLR